MPDNKDSNQSATPEGQNLTYGELMEYLLTLECDENDTVTVYIEGVDEYYPVKKVAITIDSDVLDDSHTYLAV
jgi:phosphotransferase system HPr-like phosphotransfer protein